MGTRNTEVSEVGGIGIYVGHKSVPERTFLIYKGREKQSTTGLESYSLANSYT